MISNRKINGHRAMSRRQVLRGAGGFALAIPFLPSLNRDGVAAIRSPRFFLMSTEHAAVWPENMFPPDTVLTNKKEIRPGHVARSGTLASTTSNGDNVVSSVLRGPSTRLTQRLVEKMNVLRGVGVPFDLGHNTGGHLGNYNRSNRDSLDTPRLYVPTIDQVMAWSPTFYPNAANIATRSILGGEGRNFSYYYQNPTARSGVVQSQALEYDVQALFDRAIGTPSAGPAPRRPVVDKVIEQYRSLREGNRRLSSADRETLDSYMQRLAEIEARLGRKVECGNVVRPNSGQNSDPRKYFSMLNDVIAAAFICGSSRVAVTGVTSTFVVNTLGDWHNDVAHGSKSDPAKQELMARSHREAFNAVFLDLAIKLDVDNGQGGTYLDDTLMVWAQESAHPSHDYTSTPIVTLGSAAGALNTGLYCDYRNLVPEARRETGFIPQAIYEYAGIMHNQWMAGVLDAMGVPRSEWPTVSTETGHGKAYAGFGYGRTIVDDSWLGTGNGRIDDAYLTKMMEFANQPLPVVLRA